VDCFVQKRQLHLLVQNFYRRLSGQAPQRSRQMSLIEVTSIVNDIENRRPAPQKIDGEPRALDLVQLAVCHAGRA
jgi:hypothetical protein